jgi:hypothetical protein
VKLTLPEQGGVSLASFCDDEYAIGQFVHLCLEGSLRPILTKPFRV